MSKPWIVMLCVAGGFGLSLAAMVPAAQAQFRPGPQGINPATKPAVSPYLNLTRTDVPPVISYYNYVLPDIAARNSIQQLQSQQYTLANQQQQQQSNSSTVLPPTGHSAGFLTQSKYFLKRRQGSTLI